MTILLVNDDGYESEGIHVLEDVLVRHGHEVWVSAPSSQKSASSHSMTMARDIHAVNYRPNHWHVDGFPADCVLYALRGGLFPRRPDVVVSGINHGYNISTDVLYSGTIGAASEAAMAGIPAFALSCQQSGDGKAGYPFERSAEFLAAHLRQFLPLCSTDSFVSINVPPETDGTTWESAGLSHLFYDDAVLKSSRGTVRTYDHGKVCFGTSVVLSLQGGGPSQVERSEETDFMAMRRGVVSVTVLSVLPAVDETMQERLRAMEKRG